MLDLIKVVLKQVDTRLDIAVVFLQLSELIRESGVLIEEFDVSLGVFPESLVLLVGWIA